MAEPETEPSDIAARAAEVATDISETDEPQERRTLVRGFLNATTAGARAAGRGTRAAQRGAVRGTQAVRREASSRTQVARQRASSGNNWLADQVMAMAPRLRVRNQAALREQFPGRSDEEIASALIEGAARAAAAAGAATGVASALPVLPAFPVEIAAETLVLVGIELKLVAELHEAYGTPAPGRFPERMSAYVASWSHRRGVFMIEGGLIFAAGSPLARLLRRRLAVRATRSVFSLAPMLTGAAAGALFNRRETRKLGQDIQRDLRRRAIGDG